VNKQRFQHVGFSFVNLNASVFLVFFVTNTSFVNEDCTQTTLLIRTQSAQRRHNVHKEFWTRFVVFFVVLGVLCDQYLVRQWRLHPDDVLIRTQSAQRRHNVHKEFEKIRRVLCGSWCSLWPIPRAQRVLNKIRRVLCGLKRLQQAMSRNTKAG